jgi:hypothetical protein
MEQTDSGPGYVVVQIQPHLGCSEPGYPLAGVWPPTPTATIEWIVLNESFYFNAPGGKYRVTLGTYCGICGVIYVNVPPAP